MKGFIIGLWLLLMVCLPGIALGAEAWGACGAVSVGTVNTTGANQNIAAGQSKCFYFNTTEDSDVFHVLAPTALICLDPDVATESNDGDAEVMIRRCDPGVTTASVNRCGAILDVPLDGLTGADGTQNWCKRVARASYYIENTTGAGDDEASVTIEGEGP
ncbi:MAG: hypothetical protein KAI97_05740 [Gemmatimonadetes bacterium]|nr:hypothetical protein [Gemmatimonadota bacterium]